LREWDVEEAEEGPKQLEWESEDGEDETEGTYEES